MGYQTRPVTYAQRGIVAAPHYLAAEAGLDVLKAGGSAADAAIAANAMLQVVFPFVCGLGGDTFAIIWSATEQKIYALNASGKSAATASAEKYAALGYHEMPTFGIHSVTVPGCPDGWDALHKNFGVLPLSRILEPAIYYAEQGFPVGPELSVALQKTAASGHAHTSWFSNFLPDGDVPQTGSIMKLPNLAKTFRALTEAGLKDFYTGDIARQIADFFQRENGCITLTDLAEHQSQWVEPLSAEYGDLRIYELPPNTHGATALQMMAMLNLLPPGSDPMDPKTIHLAVEAKKLAFADRDRYITDPARMTIRVEDLLNPEYIIQRSALIHPNRAAESAAPGSLSGDTIYLCAADSQGNMVSLIQSNYMGFGSGVVVENTGIALQNRGAYFRLDPHHINALEPRKRTMHTLIPSLAVQNGVPSVVFGSMGGDGQPQFHTQVYTNIIRFAANMQEAIDIPRWLHGASRGSNREQLFIESRVPESTIRELQRMGHEVVITEPWDSLMGFAQGIIRLPNGVYAGGSDPRAEGIAAGW